MDYLDNPPTALEVGHYWAPILCRMWVNFRRRLTILTNLLPEWSDDLSVSVNIIDEAKQFFLFLREREQTEKRLAVDE
jgi:hypothetical protein